MTCSLVRSLLRLVLALVSALLAADPGSATTFTVGTDPGCTHDTISGALLAAAVNGPSLDVIRIANDQSYADQNLVISNQSVSLVGGYSSCTDTTSGSTTTLDGTGAPSAPVITISGTTNGTRSVELVGLEITGGEDGGVVISGSNIVSIQRSLITGNTRANGGGISLDGSNGAVLTVTEDTSVIGNTAADPSGRGGGIYCVSSTLILHGLVATNSAWFGGGIATISCTVNDFAGGFLRGVVQNSATFGGGIAAFNSSTVNLIGGSSHPATVADNTASANGGGIYVSDSTVIATDSWITGNQADSGGGVAVSGGSFVMHRTLGDTCHDPVRCSKITGNTATGGLGGALYVELRGTAEVRQTYLEHNTALFGAAGYAEGFSGSQRSRLLLEGDAIGRNTGEYMFYVSDGAELRAGFVTSAANVAPTPTSQVSFYGNGSDTTVASMYSSLVDDLQVYGGGVNGASHTFDCLIARSTFAMPAGASLFSVEQSDPMLHNPSAGDYSLSGSSPAIDRCDTGAYAPTDLDLHNRPRGLDMPWLNNVLGPYDLGALEADILFADGFESGDTTQWSAHVP